MVSPSIKWISKIFLLRLGVYSVSYLPILESISNSSLEDLPLVDKEDLACCESFSKLYLIGKVLGKLILLKPISFKMKI